MTRNIGLGLRLWGLNQKKNLVAYYQTTKKLFWRTRYLWDQRQFPAPELGEVAVNEFTLPVSSDATHRLVDDYYPIS
jgi:hypothetical protein